MLKRFLRKRLNPSRYNGGSLLGLRGLVIKSHGGADAYSFEWAIQRAYDAAKNGVINRIEVAMAALVAAPEIAIASSPCELGSPEIS